VTGVPEVVQTKRLVVFTDTKLSPAGSVSTTRMLVAFALPMLLTVRM
jgi:hypothetical protein